MWQYLAIFSMCSLCVLVSFHLITDIFPRLKAIAAKLFFTKARQLKQNTTSALTEYISHFLVIVISICFL